MVHIAFAFLLHGLDHTAGYKVNILLAISSPDMILAALAAVGTPYLVLRTRSRVVGLGCGIILVWATMIVGSQYHQAFTPGYDSFAPALSLVLGWIPGIQYAGIWFVIRCVFDAFNSNRNPSEQTSEESEPDSKTKTLIETGNPYATRRKAE